MCRGNFQAAIFVKLAANPIFIGLIGKDEKMVAIGCDHGGFSLKTEIIKHLKSNNIEYVDCGTFDGEQAVDYPVYAKLVAKAVLDDGAVGILVCGTGIGISIAANKIKGIRAALCHDVFSAKATRQHNDSNILALGGRVIGVSLALEIVDAFLNAQFSKDARHINRISQIEG